MITLNTLTCWYCLSHLNGSEIKPFNYTNFHTLKTDFFCSKCNVYYFLSQNSVENKNDEITDITIPVSKYSYFDIDLTSYPITNHIISNNIEQCHSNLNIPNVLELPLIKLLEKIKTYLIFL